MLVSGKGAAGLFVQLDLFFQNYAACHVTNNIDAGSTHIAKGIDADVHAHNACRKTCHGGKGCEGSNGAAWDSRGSHRQKHVTRRITIIMEMLTLIPQAFAKNMIIKDMRMETASMFTVAPRGMAILVILLETPISSSMHCLLMGMVAELEQVPNAFNAAGSIALKNFTGLSLPMNFTAPPYTIKANPKNARYRITSWVASEIMVSVPLVSTTGTIVQKTPIG